LLITWDLNGYWWWSRWGKRSHSLFLWRRRHHNLCRREIACRKVCRRRGQ